MRRRQYLCRAGSAHNSVEAASIGPSWSAKVDLQALRDAGVDGEAAPILAFRGIETDARASSFADIRVRRVHRPNPLGSQRAPQQSKMLDLQTLNEPTVAHSQCDVVLGICDHRPVGEPIQVNTRNNRGTLHNEYNDRAEQGRNPAFLRCME
jgi:hypothetical protein